jgi:glycosyltransferase involved in cell wall biosynthesis
MKVYYYCPNLNHPSGGMGVLFKQAKILADNGYDVTLLYEGDGIFNPTWMEFSITHIPKVRINGLGSLRIDSNDLLVLPEGFGNLIDSTKNMKCKRTVLAQSWIYIYTSMPQPKSWKESGIEKVISVSQGITEYIQKHMSGIEVEQYKQSISPIFKSNLDKSFKVCYSSSRSNTQQMNTHALINIIKSGDKRLKNVQFIELKGMTKHQFASELGDCAFCLYTDEIAGFGTLPLEAMACNTHVVGFSNIGNKEYVRESNGFWCQNGDYHTLTDNIITELNRFLDGYEYDGLCLHEINTSSEYNEEQEKNRILDIFETFK